jgi:hypothetical protein
MTTKEFRRIALSMTGAVESAHQGHPDFRAGNKIFATLGYPDTDAAMVKLTAQQQREFVSSHAEVFAPVKGAWGAKGATQVQLRAADEETVGAALTAAWSNVMKPPRAVGKRVRSAR